MSGQREHITRWKVITLSVNTPGEIIRIDEKLATHYQEIVSIALMVSPSDQTLQEIAQCGELSLLINGQTNHFFHMSAGYSEELPIKCAESVKIYQELYRGRLTGYYIDEKKVLNDEQLFIPYKVKIHMEFNAQQRK